LKIIDRITIGGEKSEINKESSKSSRQKRLEIIVVSNSDKIVSEVIIDIVR